MCNTNELQHILQRLVTQKRSLLSDIVWAVLVALCAQLLTVVQHNKITALHYLWSWANGLSQFGWHTIKLAGARTLDWFLTRHLVNSYSTLCWSCLSSWSSLQHCVENRDARSLLKALSWEIKDLWPPLKNKQWKQMHNMSGHFLVYSILNSVSVMSWTWGCFYSMDSYTVTSCFSPRHHFGKG